MFFSKRPHHQQSAKLKDVCNDTRPVTSCSCRKDNHPEIKHEKCIEPKDISNQSVSSYLDHFKCIHSAYMQSEDEIGIMTIIHHDSPLNDYIKEIVVFDKNMNPIATKEDIDCIMIKTDETLAPALMSHLDFLASEMRYNCNRKFDAVSNVEYGNWIKA